MSSEDCHTRFSIDEKRVKGYTIVIFWHVCRLCEKKTRIDRQRIVEDGRKNYKTQYVTVVEHYFRDRPL